jgi:hypothetical protein
MKKNLLFVLITLTGIVTAQAQSKFSKYSIFGGVGLGQEDRRLFNWPNQDKILRRSPKRLDRTYTVGILMDIWKYKRLEATAGIGYMAQNTRFKRPYDGTYFVGQDKLVWIQRYTISQLSLPLSLTLYLDHNKRFGIIANGTNNISFRRRFTHTQSEWKLSYKSLEFYPGVIFRLNDHINVDALYRLYYLNNFDELTTGLAMRWGYEDIQFERYNPSTIMVRLRYHL